MPEKDKEKEIKEVFGEGYNYKDHLRPLDMTDKKTVFSTLDLGKLVFHNPSQELESEYQILM